MKRFFKNTISLLLVAIMVLSTAPISEIAKIDFPHLFGTVAYAVESALKLGCELGEIDVVSSKREGALGENELATQANDISTQASDTQINLTVGDVLELKINVRKQDENGNIVDAEPGDFPEISWSANPAESVELSVNSSDTRYCSIKLLSDEKSPIYIYATMGNQRKTFTIYASKITFDKNEYYILMDDTNLVYDLENGLNFPSLYGCYAIWTPKEEDYTPEGYEFISSDEKILRINGSGSYSDSGKKVNYYPDVYGVKEGEVTLTIKAPNGQTATCKVTVVGMKEYTIEAYSKDIEKQLADAEITYNIIRNNLSTQSETATIKTNKEGVAVIRLPDVRYFPNSKLKIASPFHDEKIFKANILKLNEINRASLVLNYRLDDFNTSEESVEALKTDIADEVIALLQFQTKIEIKGVTASALLDYDEHKIKITLGLKTGYSIEDGKDKEKQGEYFKNYQKYKNFYKGLKNNKDAWNTYQSAVKQLKSKEHKGAIGVSCDFTVAGYVELDYSTGKVKFSEGGISFVASTGWDKKIYTQIPAVYIAFGISGEIGGSLALKVTSAGSFGMSAKVSFSVNPSAGVGVGCDIAKLEIGIKGELKFEITISEEKITLKNLIKITAEIDAYLEYKVDVWIVKWGDEFTMDLAEFEIFPNPSAHFFWQPKSIDESSFVLSSRNYLNDANTCSYDGEFLLSNVYPNGAPQIVALDNGIKVAVWLADNGDKSDINRSTLMYSVWKNGLWSQEKAVSNSDKIDCEAELCTDGDYVYALWKRGNKVFDDDTTIDDYSQNMQLVYSRFDGESWTELEKVGNVGNGKYQLYYSIAADNGNVTISWTENSENDLFLSQGITTVYQQDKQTNWKSPVEVIKTDESINSVAAGFINGIAVTSYVIDEDAATSNDNIVVIGDFYQSSKDFNSVAVTYQDDKFYWLENEKLCYYDDKKEDTGLTVGNDYSIVSCENKKSVIYPVFDGFNSELYVSNLTNTNDYFFVPLTNYGNKIGSYSAVMNNDGSITTAIDVKNLDDNKFTSTDFIIDTFCDYKDVSLTDVWSEYETSDSGELKINIYGTAKNTGVLPISDYIVELKTSENSFLESEEFYCSLESGESQDFVITHIISDNLKDCDYKLGINTSEDFRSDNNEQDISIAVADVKIINSEISKDGLIQLTIKNTGKVNLNQIALSIYKQNEELDLLTNINSGDLSLGETKTISYQISKSMITFDSYLYSNSFACKVECNELEFDYSNNDVTLVINPINVSEIRINAEQIKLVCGENYSLVATVLPSNAVTKTVYWFTDDESVATVDETGKITAVGYGATTIRAITSDGRFEKTCTVTVASTVPVTDISILDAQIGLVTGGTQQLTATISPSNATNKNVTWKSSNTSVATVSSTGLVTAKSVGTATITVTTADGGKTAICVVTVTNSTVSVTGVTISPTSKNLTVGDTQRLTATVSPSNATNKNVTWKSSNTSVATVSSTGLVTAKSAGTVTITVTTIDGNKSAVCSITVTAKSIEKTLVKIEINSSPSTYTYQYKYGGQIDLTGLTLKATYSDGSTEIISDTNKMIVNDFNVNSTGTKAATVEYEGQTTTFNYEVKYVWWQWIILILLFGWIWY